MPSRMVVPGLVAAAALVLSACAGGATPSPSAPASAAASPSAGPSAAASPSGAASPASTLKIGVVTDVGTVNDKNFNEYSYDGAKKGAADVGAPEPPVVVPKDPSEYAKDIQSFIDQGFNVIVTVGFNLGADTTKAAKGHPDIWFIGVDQSPICVDEQGNLDTTFACKGDAAKLLPHYISLAFQEDQAGYLAGIVAAAVSKTGEIGAIGGITLCAPCVRYIQGYELGAQSYNPNIVVKSAYVTTSDFTKAFNDPVTGKNFAQQFLKQNPKVDVLFQVAGKTGNGVLDAACDAGIWGIGVDVDQYLSYPNADKCIVTSAEKHLSKAVEGTIQGIAAGTAKGGDNHWNASNDGIGVAPFYDKASIVPADVTAKIQAALEAMKAGTLQTCPSTCGQPPQS